MTPRNTLKTRRGMSMVLSTLAALGLLAGAASAEQAGASADRAVVGKSASQAGMLFRREAEQKPWQVVKEGEALHSGDLLLGLPGAALDSADGAVRLTFRPDLSASSPLPIIETAVILQTPKGADFAFTLDRGRVVLTNQRKQGAARIQGQRNGQTTGELTLVEPGAAVALEIYSRWPAGVPFTKEPKPGTGPSVALLFLVLKGHVEVKVDTRQFAMSAPPGPALIEHDSLVGGDMTPQRLDKLPAWAVDEGKPEMLLKKKTILNEFRQLAASKGIEAAAETLLGSSDPDRRRLAVYALGATDNLKRLGEALADTKHPDVWENGVIALRHWIGRGPGQDQKLYQALVKDRNFTPVDAESVLQLLHSFGEAERAHPELYDCLIDYLEHPKLAVRGLAYWHLFRLVPEGQKLNYDPLAGKEARAQAVAAWRKLIPPGKLPPRLRKDKP